MCDIIHQRHYKFWLRFDSIFKLTSFFEKQKQLLGIIHGLTNKVIIMGLVDFLYHYAIIKASPDSRRIPWPMDAGNARSISNALPIIYPTLLSSTNFFTCHRNIIRASQNFRTSYFLMWPLLHVDPIY